MPVPDYSRLTLDIAIAFLWLDKETVSMDKTPLFNAICSSILHAGTCTGSVGRSAGAFKSQNGLKRPGLAVCAAVLAALALSACGGGHPAGQQDTMTTAPKTVPVHAVPAPSPARSAAIDSTANQSADAMDAKDLGAKAELPAVERVVEAPEAPAEGTPQTIIETTIVAEKSTDSVETIEIVETPDAVAERKETVATTERIVDRVEVDEQQGRVTETVDVEVSTQKTTDVVVVDKRTGDSIETVVQSEPVVKETKHLAVTVERLPGPKDPSRQFTGPDGIDLLQLAGYGIVAIKTNALASDRNRLQMICETFTSPTPGLDEKMRAATTPGMLTAWPISSTAHADELNNAATSPDCSEAVERYGVSEGMKALQDVERSGWILEGRGPFLVAWAPPLAKGSPGEPVLLADLSTVSTPDAALAAMHRWAIDIETNTELWNESRWNVDRLRLVMERWQDEFGPRVLMLLGPVGG